MIALLFSLLVATAPQSVGSTVDVSLPEELLYAGLDPYSIQEQYAFYLLHPDSNCGKRALQTTWKLLNCRNSSSLLTDHTLQLPSLDLQRVVSLVSREASQPLEQLSQDELQLMESLASSLPNRKLKGFSIWTQEELLALEEKEIDLGRALLIAQLGEEEASRDRIRQYEASLDLMALQIAARVAPQATSVEKINAINHFIFYEMKFRYPPHSIYAKNIDLYTFLPSVLDGRQGVCLGVSILYLCLAQRLDLPLEIVTPPGHIYLRAMEEKKEINIETTARGIDLPSETYLGINTRSLEQRSLKEVIGLAFLNQASLFWAEEKYKEAVSCYEKAQLFIHDNPSLKMFLGLNYLFIGKKGEGEKLLQQVRNIPFDFAVSAETIPDDYLRGKLSIEGIKILFSSVDDHPESIVKKQKKLRRVIKKEGESPSVLFHQAITYLQLGEESKAYPILERYHQMNPSDPTAAYYLAVLSLDRLDYNSCWKYLKASETITAARGHHPKVLQSLRHHLRTLSPEF